MRDGPVAVHAQSSKAMTIAIECRGMAIQGFACRSAAENSRATGRVYRVSSGTLK
jgi:hypothetical protein